MGFFDKIKEFFLSKEDKEVIEEVNLNEIDSFLEKKKNYTQNTLNDKSDWLYGELVVILDKLEDDAKIVENINIQDKKVEEKIKNINEAGRKDYLSELYKLIENLHIKKEGEQEIIYITSELNKFLKNTKKSYYYATLVVGDEMKTIKNGIIKIEKLEEEFRRENSELIENKRKIEELMLRNKEYKEKLEFNERLIIEIDKTKKDIEDSQKNINELNSKIEEIKSSSDYLEKQKLLKEKSEKEDSLKIIESNVNLLIDKKILEKYVYFTDNKENKRIAESYIKNTPQSLLNDNELKILDVVEDVKDKIDNRIIIIKDFGKAINKISVDKFKIKDYQDNLENTLEKIKNLSEEIESIKAEVDLDGLLNEKAKEESYIQELTLHLDALKKRQEKAQNEINDIESELISEAKKLS